MGALMGAYMLGQANTRLPQAFQEKPDSVISPQADTPSQPESSQAPAENPVEKVQASLPDQANASPEEIFAKEFETFLNNFLKELSKEIRQYKKDRRILKEAVDPFNLIGTQNAEQSYRVFKEEIAPLLKKKSERVMGVFERANTVVKALLTDKPEDTQSVLMAEWEALEKVHMSKLLDFFENEDRLINAHEELLKFYFIHSKLYTVDMDSGEIIFNSEKHREKEKAILDKINKIKQDFKKSGI